MSMTVGMDVSGAKITAGWMDAGHPDGNQELQTVPTMATQMREAAGTRESAPPGWPQRSKAQCTELII